MDYWSRKHVELLNVMNKINHQILCILLDYVYIAKWYTVHTISNWRNICLIDYSVPTATMQRQPDATWHSYLCPLFCFSDVTKANRHIGFLMKDDVSNDMNYGNYIYDKLTLISKPYFEGWGHISIFLWRQLLWHMLNDVCSWYTPFKMKT